MDISFVEIFLEEAEDLISSWESTCLSLENNPDDPELWNSLFRAAHTLKGSSKSVGMIEFSAFIHKIEDLLIILKEDPSRANQTCFEILSASCDITREWMSRVESGEDKAPEYQAVLARLSEVLPQAVAPGESPPSRTSKTTTEVPKKSKSVVRATGRAKMLRISSEKIEKLMLLIGEIYTQGSIVFHHRRIGQLDNEKCAESLTLLEETFPTLRDLTMELRMDTLEKFFQRMEKTCTDVARSLDKPVEVIIEGREIELDKTIVDRIVDPFVHIVRNAVDHGIEDQVERQATGKPLRAKVTLSAKTNGSQVTITVAEDGRGMNPEILINKAFEKGLITHKNLTAKEAYQLILKPGFSTKDVVSDLSGRGVGMDVVATTLADLGGSLDIESSIGNGSKFTAMLPASIAIVDSFVVESVSSFFVVPQMDVIEVLELDDCQLTRVSDSEIRILEYRNQKVPVINLGEYFSQEKPQSNARQAFLVSSGHGDVAVEVDRIAWKQQIVARKVEGKLADMMGVSGVTILSDGEPSLILSLKEFASEFQRRQAA